MKKQLIWLDDIRDPVDYLKNNISNYKIYWVKNYEEFIDIYNLLKYSTNIELSLDHDLGEDLTGYDCVKYIVNDCMKRNTNLPFINIHSANPVGKNNMISYINNYKKIFKEYERH